MSVFEMAGWLLLIFVLTGALVVVIVDRLVAADAMIEVLLREKQK